MVGKSKIISLLPVYGVVLTLLVILGFVTSHSFTAIKANTAIGDRPTVIIDPGHGGIDGGATACNGVLESQINLEIALKLDDLFHLLGIQTKMLRSTDTSIHTHGSSIAAIKVSDLKERVRICNETPNGLLISIHQNHFSDERYKGAQVFYAPYDGSDILAREMQSAFVATVNPNSKRLSKKADGIYIMQNISCPGILVECGFLSNAEEAHLLCSGSHQNKLCCIIASTVTKYLSSNQLT